MTQAEYAILRYVADPARSEALNVGIVVSDADGFRVGIDQSAVIRALRDNPRLAVDSLQGLEQALETHIADYIASVPAATIGEAVQSMRIMSLVVSESRFTAVDMRDADPLGHTLARLIGRIVTPKRRPGAAGADSLAALRQTFQPLIRSHKIIQQYQFPQSRSGAPRHAHFFANSGTNVAIDAITMPAAKAAAIVRAADAEAFKIEDVLRANHDVQRYLIYCPFVDKPQLAQANEQAMRVLTVAGGEIRTDLAHLAHELSDAVGA